MSRKHQLRKLQDKIFLENMHKPNIILETGNWLTCLRLVESGLASTIFPNLKTDLNIKRVKKYSFEKEYSRQTVLCYRKNAFSPKILRAFIDTATMVFEQQ